MDIKTGFYADSIELLDKLPLAEPLAGNQDTLLRECLVVNYENLHRRLTRYVGCGEQASDALQDAWLRLGDMSLPKTVANPEAYVYRVACNLAMDCIRANRLWRYTSDGGVELEHVADSVPGPDSIAEVRSDLNALERAIKGLPYYHQDILICLRLGEMTRQEVAARYGLSLRNIDTILRQALDHCANQTGQTIFGGVSTARRSISEHRRKNPDPSGAIRVAA